MNAAIFFGYVVIKSKLLKAAPYQRIKAAS